MKIGAVGAAAPSNNSGAASNNNSAPSNNTGATGGGGRGRRRRGGGGTGPKDNNGGPPTNTPKNNAPQNNSAQNNTPSKPKGGDNKQSDIAAANYNQQRGQSEKNQTQTFGAANRQNKNYNQHPKKSSENSNSNNSAAGNNNTSGGNWECSCCNRSKFHELSGCKEFLAKNQNDRFLFLKSNGLCNKCLARGHMARDCKSESGCDHCPGRFHHSLLHRDFNRQKDKEDDNDESDDSSDDSDHHE